MACSGCGQKAAQAVQYQFTSPQGKVTVYRTEIEARAAVIRQGGGTVMTVPK